MPATQTINATPTLRLNGSEDERLSSLLTAMVMTEQVGGLSSLELRVSNSASLTSGSAEYAFDADGDLALGAELIVAAGDAAAPVEIFRGAVTGLEGLFGADAPPELVILAEDGLQKARLARHTKVFENRSLAAIVREIAGAHGLTPQISGLEQNFGTQVQMNETDLGFLRRLLGRADADLQMVRNELHVSPRADVRRGELELELADGLRSVRVFADLAHQITKSTAKGWDVSAGSAMQAEGQDNATGPGEGGKGSAAMSAAFADRTQHAGEAMTFNQSEVDTVATTLRNQRARRFLRAQGVATGNPALRVGTHVRLRGLGDWFSNTFHVVKARHLFDRREGYRTEFEAECAFLGRSS